MNAVLSSINPSPGVARQLLTFFVSPKKVSKERRPRDPGPSDFPVLRSKKWEGKQTRCAQTSFPSFSIFRIASPAGSKRNGQTGSLRIAGRRRRCDGCRSLQPLKKRPRIKITMPQASHPRQCEASRKRNSAYESPLVTCSNRIKKGNLSERSEFVSLPDLSAAPTGTPKGRRIAVAFLCLLSLAKQRK